MMHREKKHLMPLCFRPYLDHRFLISISIHPLQQPGSQPLFFPRDPSLCQPLPQIALCHLAWYYRISAHRMQGTALQDNQTTRGDMAESLRGKPPLKHGPVTLGMIIAFAVLRFKRQTRPREPAGLLHGMHATPPAACPTHPLHKIMV